MIQKLVDNGLAYVAGGDVYYDVSRFEPYGELSGQNIDDLKAGARVEPGEAKQDPLDFALWKAAKPGEPAWDSPWGARQTGMAHRVQRHVHAVPGPGVRHTHRWG